MRRGYGRGTTVVLAAAALAATTVACSGSEEKAEPTTGAEVYRAVCATCHGRDGAGFVGPSLSGVAARYPNVADQVAVVTNGGRQMPAFGAQLTPEQIQRVVDYTRATFVDDQSPTTTPVVGPTLPSTGR